jgi:15-cis-phytoene synthase
VSSGRETSGRGTPGNGALIRQAAKDGEPDRYLAATLAPAEVRDDLITLAAFLAEIGRIGRDVSDPRIGEIRVQWWRDALDAGRNGALSGNPIADRFADVVVRHKLSQDAIHGLLDANVHGLYGGAPPSVAALQQDLILREAAAFQFAAHILGAAPGRDNAGMCDDAGLAYGLARLGRHVPYALAFGREPLPPQWTVDSQSEMRAAVVHLATLSRACLERVKGGWHDASMELKSALLPVALVEPYLRVLEKPGHDAAHDVADVAPLVRVGRIALAHFRGRL